MKKETMTSSLKLNSGTSYIWKAVGIAAVITLLWIIASGGMNELIPNDYLMNQITHGSLKETCDHQCKMDSLPTFAIHTPTCVIPEINPLDPTLFYHKIYPVIELNCSKNMHPLSYSENYYLVMDPEAFPDYGVSTFKDLHCYYAGIRRIEQDSSTYDVKRDNLYRFKERITIKELRTPIEEDAIVVNCTPIFPGLNTKPYSNFHYYIQMRDAENKVKEFSENGGWRNNNEMMNVLLLGVGSVSRVNLRRHMPKFYEYILDELGGLDFRGLNVVGGHSQSNLLPLFTSLHYEEFFSESVCKPVGWSYADSCPFIWKEFSKNGYVTTYVEDVLNSEIFLPGNFPGFIKKPTDYYMRSYIKAAQDYISHHGGYTKIRESCIGTQKSATVLSDIAYDVSLFLKDVPIFTSVWYGHPSHETMRDAAIVEEPLMSLLKKLKKSGSLENTAVFIISDQGMVFGSFRKTYVGALESRMPFFIVILPEWFKKKYTETWKNLKTNTRRLITHFDIHETMRSVTYQDYSPTNPPEIPSIRNFSQSLFLEVPLSRTCADAYIEAHFCTCEDKEVVNISSPEVFNAAQTMVAYMNKLLSKYSSLCAMRELKWVLDAKKIIPKQAIRSDEKEKNVNAYTIQFTAYPSDADFEGTVAYDEGHYRILGNISRINMFQNESRCIEHDLALKPYCYCKT